MRMKKDDQPLQKVLKHTLNHSLLQQILEAARQCDQVQALLNEGKAKLAFELILPLAIDSKPLSMAERVRDLAITVLDELISDCHSREDFEAALEYLEKWIRLKPSDLYPLILKGEILYLEMDDPETAYQVFRQAVKLSPNCLEAWIALANIECRRGRYRKAVRFLIRAWQVLNNIQWGYPVTAPVVTNIFESLYGTTAMLLTVFGDKKGAKAIITKGMKVVGGHSDYLNKILELLELTKGDDI